MPDPVAAPSASGAGTQSVGSGAAGSAPGPGTSGTPAAPGPATSPGSSQPTSAPGARPAEPAAPVPAAGSDPTRDEHGRFKRGATGRQHLVEIPGLPGVIADPSEQPLDEPAQAATAAAAAGAVPLPAPPVKADAAPTGTPATPPPAPAAPFTFGGVEFESREKAEQSFKTLRGQFKSMETKVSEATAHANRAAEVALSWKALAEDYERNGVLDPSTGKPRAGTQPTTPPAEPEKPAGIDWQMFELLNENHGPLVANIWLEEQRSAIQAKSVEEAIAKALGPIQPVIAQQQATQQLTQLLSEVVTYVDPFTQQPAYPELTQQASAEAVLSLLPKIGLTPEQAMSPMGIQIAVALYRDQMARARTMTQPGQAPAAPSTPPPGSAPAAHAPAASPEAVAAAAAAAAVASGVQPPVMQPAGANGASVLSAIRNAGIPLDRMGLGFAE